MLDPILSARKTIAFATKQNRRNSCSNSTCIGKTLPKIHNKHASEWTENTTSGDKWYEENQIGIKR